MNLFIKTEHELKLATEQPILLSRDGTVSDVDPVLYSAEIDINRIKATTGSTRTGKVYSVIELGEIMLQIFGTRYPGEGKDATVAFLHRPENIKILERHNERVREAKRMTAQREIRDTPRDDDYAPSLKKAAPKRAGRGQPVLRQRAVARTRPEGT